MRPNYGALLFLTQTLVTARNRHRLPTHLRMIVNRPLQVQIKKTFARARQFLFFYSFFSSSSSLVVYYRSFSYICLFLHLPVKKTSANLITHTGAQLNQNVSVHG